jgi:hypothetical protein
MIAPCFLLYLCRRCAECYSIALPSSCTLYKTVGQTVRDSAVTWLPGRSGQQSVSLAGGGNLGSAFLKPAGLLLVTFIKTGLSCGYL